MGDTVSQCTIVLMGKDRLLDNNHGIRALHPFAKAK
jgi:hypothetical protein